MGKIAAESIMKTLDETITFYMGQKHDDYSEFETLLKDNLINKKALDENVIEKFMEDYKWIATPSYYMRLSHLRQKDNIQNGFMSMIYLAGLGALIGVLSESIPPIVLIGTTVAIGAACIYSSNTLIKKYENDPSRYDIEKIERYNLKKLELLTEYTPKLTGLA